MERNFGPRTATFAGLLCFCLACSIVQPGSAQPSPEAHISWEVANRFRLFAEQKDFDLQVNHSAGKSVLEAEHSLEDAFKGRGWASSVGRLCYDRTTGELLQTCVRDNKRENYLKPNSHLIKLKVTLPPQFSAAQCTWTIGEIPGARPFALPCSETITDQRVPDEKATPVHVVASTGTGQTIASDTTILAQDFLIVGLGDSTASGEGNPDQPVTLSDTGFCFARLLGGSQFYLPGRANALNVADDCADHPGDSEAWDKAAAGWLFAACHRSLYSYQMRAALALAIENPDISVTFIPLGCTGATIQQGLLGPEAARERRLVGGTPGPRYVEGQLDQLAEYLGVKSKLRSVDLIFLTVGANDVGFSGLVADVIVNGNPERSLIDDMGLITSPDKAEGPLKVDLKNDFEKLREKLAPFVGGDLERVVFVNYGDPARHQGGRDCPTSRQGFDAHPAFSVNGAELTKVVNFVENRLLPTLKNYAICGDATAGCSDAAKQDMTFAANHQNAFLDHGFCAVSDNDPEFDRVCFKNGNSFEGPPDGLEKPLSCKDHIAPEFRPYAQRSRWVRTANDSYFTAMTYPWTAHSLLDNPASIHDGRWGLTSVVYGGVLHPTAEGQAAMADAALTAANSILKLPHVGIGPH
jgi:hypothetical protein